MNFTKEDQIKVEEAIKTIELTTSGEIVPAIFGQSDFYPASHFRLSLFIGLLVPSIFLFFTNLIQDPLDILWLQIPGIVLGYYLAYIPIFKRYLSTKAEKLEEVHQRALQAFFENDLHTTEDRTGILIMISVLEHRVEILADQGINDKVPQDTWNKILEPLVHSLKQDRLGEGLVHTIVECGKILSKHFPIKENDKNELSNKIVTDSN